MGRTKNYFSEFLSFQAPNGRHPLILLRPECLFLVAFFEERTKDHIENAKRTNMSVFTLAIAMVDEKKLRSSGLALGGTGRY